MMVSEFIKSLASIRMTFLWVTAAKKCSSARMKRTLSVTAENSWLEFSMVDLEVKSEWVSW